MILRFALLLLLGVAALRGQTNSMLIPFQARLTDQQGTPRTNGVYTLIFNIYDQAVGGSNLWTERHERVGIVNGMVNVFLGSITPLDDPAPGVDFSSTRYLGITIDADQKSETSDPEMVSRQMIIPAFAAKNSEKLAGRNWSSILVSGNDPEAGFIKGAKIQPNGVSAPQLALGSVTTPALAASAVTFTNIARRRESFPPSDAPIGSLAFSAPVPADVPVTGTWSAVLGSTVVMTNAGGPMLVTLAPLRSSLEVEEAYISIKKTPNTPDQGKLGALIGLYEDGQLICTTRLLLAGASVGGGTELMLPTSFSMLVFAKPGRHEYRLVVKTPSPDMTSTTISFRGRLALIEL